MAYPTSGQSPWGDDLKGYVDSLGIAGINAKHPGGSLTACAGDGTTSDTAALQAIINSLPLNTADTGVLSPKGFANGGTIFLPRGRYVVDGTITLRRGMRIIGESRESTQIISKTPGTVFYYADAGRYIQDEIVFENLSIWQDASVVATSGAGIYVGFGTASVLSTKLLCRNVYIEGTYRGYLHEAGVGSAFINCDASRCVTNGFELRYTDGTYSSSTTSTTFMSCYASLNGGDGYHVTRGGYCSWVACASDTNTGYGYYLEDGIGHHVQGGAEENVAGAVYLKNTDAAMLTINVVHSLNTAVKHAVSLEGATRTTLLGGYQFAGAGITGYGLHMVGTASGPTTVIGTSFQGGYATQAADFTFRLLNLNGSNTGTPSGGSPVWMTGTGSPNSAVSAPVGSLFTRTDGGASTTLYVKESGTGNTGWVAK